MQRIIEWMIPIFDNSANLIYGCMLLLFLVGMIDLKGNGILHLNKTSRQLKRAYKKLNNEAEGYWRPRFFDIDDNPADDLFTDRTLIYQMNLFQKELIQAETNCSGVRHCDIGEFFNEELLDQIGNCSFNDHISGAFTALGVLGTFIGLTMGLAEFNTTSSDQIMNGVSSLLKGMSFAFTTSIVGITLSLLFGSIIRWQRSDAENNLDLFLDSFRNRVISSNKEAAVNKIQKSLESMEFFDDSIVEAIRGPLLEMKESLDQYNDKVAEYQINSIKTIADIFVEKLSEIMQESANSFEMSLQGVSAKSDELTLELNNTVSSLKDVKKEFADLSGQTRTLTKEYGNVNKDVRALNHDMEKKLNQIDNALEHNRDALNTMLDITDAMRDQLNHIMALSSTTQEINDKAVNTLGIIRENSEALVRNNQDAFLDYEKELMNMSLVTVDELKKYSTGTIEDSQQALQDYLQTLLISYSEYSETLKKITEKVMPSDYKKNEELYRKLLETTKSNETQIGIAVESLEKTQAQLDRIATAVENNTKRKGFFSILKEKI